MEASRNPWIPCFEQTNWQRCGTSLDLQDRPGKECQTSFSRQDCMPGEDIGLCTASRNRRNLHDRDSRSSPEKILESSLEERPDRRCIVTGGQRSASLTNWSQIMSIDTLSFLPLCGAKAESNSAIQLVRYVALRVTDV
uniref:Uncharacterized protein n=1 Tax=Salix viminalis TaxID=40686 RepID=A0A6N2KSZ2_SALVM